MAGGEVTREDVQRCSSPDGVRAFFSRLDYDVSDPIDLTATSLGIAERVQHTIRLIRRIAVHRITPGGPAGLEVYCFEVTSLTADVRKTIVTAFRDQPAKTLLVMGNRDWDPLAFVLIQKSLREARGPGGQVVLSHQLLSVDRRNPSPLHLRVLERMRNKAADPYGQFDRLTDTFKFAEWSEDVFNNRGLFSDYFLKHRLTMRDLFPVWQEDVKAAQRQFEAIFQAAGEPSTLEPAEYARRFVEPILEGLGFDFDRMGANAEADYLLRPHAAPQSTPPCAGLLVYPWDRPLDRKDDRNRDRAEDVPGIRVVKALEQHGLPWAVLTNGKDWRLYCAKAHSRASNYYEIDLPAAIEREDLLAFRHFYQFFRAAAFASVSGGTGPAGEPICFLDQLRHGSTAFAKELGERLRGHIFDDVFPYLAQGFVDYRKEHFDEATPADDPFLDEVYDATLTLLYRLLFLLYAESLDLLPAREPAYSAISLTRLKEEIGEAAGKDVDSVEKRLKDRYSRTDTGIYKRLADLFKVIDEGEAERNVPVYHGGLFETAPDAKDRSREAAAARFLKKHRVPDFHLARALDLLARGEDSKSHELGTVDYKSLGVRQLGTIYEGLLIYHVVIPRDEWEKGFLRPGLKVALVPSNKQRKSTGSYFTPQHIVKYIVTNTVGPLLTEKLEAIAPRLREAQREYVETRDFERKRAEKIRTQLPRADEEIARQIATRHESVVWDLFDLKVLDPAMGSGHFLVETVDFITDKVLDFLAGFPWNPVHVLIERRIRRPILESLDTQGVKINEQRLTDVNLIKRLVMKRCVYGVDLNPMAVELSKVSLWLDSFTLGAPLSFLDHHLKCGNSLIGSSIEVLKKTVVDSGSLFAIPMEPLERATKGMELIADLTDATLAEAERSAETYRQVLAGVEGYRVLLDCLTAQNFGVPQAADIVVHAESLGLKLDDWDRSLEKAANDRQRRKMVQLINDASRMGAERRFFHWDTDFPDVFFTDRRKPEHRAFDAVVGNPPYGYRVLGDDAEAIDGILGVAESENVAEHFVVRSLSCVPVTRAWGMVIPKQLTYTLTWGRLRDYLLRTTSIVSIVDVSEAFDEVLLEQVVVVLRHKTEESYQIPICQYLNEGLRLIGHLDSHLCSRRIWPIYCVGPAGEMVAKVLSSATSVGTCYHIENGLKNVRSLIGQHVGHPCLIGDNVGRYERIPPILNIRRSGLTDEVRSRLCRPKVLAQKIVAHLTNPCPYLRVTAMWDNTESAIFETAIAFVPREEKAVSSVALLAVLNSSYCNWIVYNYIYNRSVRTMHFTGDYSGMVPLPATWADRGNPDVQDLDYRAHAASTLGADKQRLVERFKQDMRATLDAADGEAWSGVSSFADLDYLGWAGRYPAWSPDERTAAADRWFLNDVAPPIPGGGPGEIPWDTIASVYPSYPLPGIDASAWEQAAWEEFCDLLRKNKSRIGSARVLADLTGRGAITNPTGPMRKLQETFLKYHSGVRENRAQAAEIDFVIDRIVFRLFNLTLDEQRLILSSVGPGRSLPPRRGRGRGRKAVARDSTPSLFAD